MTRTEMLTRIGLQPSQFNDLLLKFGEFYASLSAPQKAVVNRAVPSLRRAARSFGRDVTGDDLRQILTPPANAPGGTFEWNGLEQILTKSDDDETGSPSPAQS